MKIKKNIAISLIKDLIQDDKFKKEIIDLISSTSDSSGVAKLEEKKIFNNLLKVHKKTVDDVMVPRGEIIFIDEKIDKENLIKIINKEAHSRMPVVKEDLKTVWEWFTSRIYSRKSTINHSKLRVFYER